MAEWVLRARVAEAGLTRLIEVDSAGTGGWHVGEGADPRTVQTLARNGFPSRHVARRFQRADLLRRDLVIALDSSHLRTLRQWAAALPGTGAGRGDGDGDGDGDDRTSRVAELRLLREFDPEAEPGRWDVPDPYYGSLAGFEECLAMVQDAMPGLLSYLGKALETRAG
ncbi:low molecular weight phosphotyrosine protein phosphatase [Actinocrinis puniceicyclus]|uniref:protein-tyrosine-phosphatase n=1 Tax=Actinocrinis puniceicyclus TaxID=977794 RepID=A0A8J8BCM7_9ACTN|nr:low molecular weight phosphotyrosine protein phosphatase [Actinocrinis puniceicyclus]